MITVRDGNIQINKGKAVIGYDLTKTTAQISYYFVSDPEPQTVSVITGAEQYNIPTVLSKRPGVGQWLYGQDAIKSAEEGYILVDDLLLKALRGEEVMVEDCLYDPVSLLTLFIKRTLGLLNMGVGMKNTEAFMFTVEELDTRVVEVLSRIAATLNLQDVKISYESHKESFYNYVLHQSPELWARGVLSFEYNEGLTSMLLESTKNTKPSVVTIRSAEYSGMSRITWPEDENEKENKREELDLQFADIARNVVEKNDIGTVYLLGDGFKEGWAKESLRVVCRNRRVFQGNNLYSKGACYSMRELLNPSELDRAYVYLGDDKLKSNIGMKALRRGEDSYFAILDAGKAWYKAKADFDMILEDGDEFSLILTSVTGGHITEKVIKLDGLPKRPRGTTRLSFHVEMSSINTLEIEITDLGFGEIIKSSGRAWNHSIEI